MANIFNFISSNVNIYLLFGILVAGMVLLVFGAEWLVDGASSFAKRLKIPELIIGLTIVAFGTSMPEFVVNMTSVVEGATDLAITNILGSNIINTFVILGLTAIVYPVISKKNSMRWDMPFSVLAGVLIFLLIYFGKEHIVSRFEGSLLFAGFIIYMAGMIYCQHKYPNTNEQTEIKPIKITFAIGLIILGIISLIIGGELIVKSATSIAYKYHVSESIIGLTIVALGTSLPELATSIVAAFKKNNDIALGNVLGSNIFNVFFVLGISSLCKDLPAYEGIQLDSMMVALGGLLVLIFVITNKKHEIKRWEGLILLLIYVVYLIYRLNSNLVSII